MFGNLKEGRLAVRGSTVDYAVFGRGSRPLVIIPGLTLRDVRGAGAGLAMMYRQFSRDYRVYVIDKKADIPRGYTVRDLAEDLAVAMELLEIDRADVFGVSLGGMIAQYLAIYHPARVHSLVLGVTLSRPNSIVRGVIRQWIEMAERDAFRDLVRDMMPLMYSERYIKRYRWLVPVLARVGVPKNKERFLHLAESCLSCDVYGELDRITAPTLVLGGEQDRIVTGEASREIAERLGCDIHMYEHLGHAAYEEAPDFNSRIERFLREHTTDEYT